MSSQSLSLVVVPVVSGSPRAALEGFAESLVLEVGGHGAVCFAPADLESSWSFLCCSGVTWRAEFGVIERGGGPPATGFIPGWGEVGPSDSWGDPARGPPLASLRGSSPSCAGEWCLLVAETDFRAGGLSAVSSMDIRPKGELAESELCDRASKPAGEGFATRGERLAGGDLDVVCRVAAPKIGNPPAWALFLGGELVKALVKTTCVLRGLPPEGGATWLLEVAAPVEVEVAFELAL